MLSLWELDGEKQSIIYSSALQNLDVHYKAAWLLNSSCSFPEQDDTKHNVTNMVQTSAWDEKAINLLLFPIFILTHKGARNRFVNSIYGRFGCTLYIDDYKYAQVYVPTNMHVYRESGWLRNILEDMHLRNNPETII